MQLSLPARKCCHSATAELRVERGHVRGCTGTNGQYQPTSLARTRLLLAGNDTVPISTWLGGIYALRVFSSYNQAYSEYNP